MQSHCVIRVGDSRDRAYPLQNTIIFVAIYQRSSQIRDCSSMKMDQSLPPGEAHIYDARYKYQ